MLPFLAVRWAAEKLVDTARPPVRRGYDRYSSKRAEVNIDRMEEKRAAERWENIPQALPEGRAPSISSLAITNSQSQSSFLTHLPLEIRQEIYSYVVAGDLKHVVRKGNKLAHVRCILSWEPDFSRACRPAAVGTCHAKASRLASTSNGNVALLRTCRQVYAEAVELMYSGNAFDFDHQDLFLHFSASVLPQRLAVIRRLHLDVEIPAILLNLTLDGPSPRAWGYMWMVVGRYMPGLKHLNMRIIGGHETPYLTLADSSWMDSIVQVRNLKTFRVEFCIPPHKLHHWLELGYNVFEMTTMLECQIRSLVCPDL